METKEKRDYLFYLGLLLILIGMVLIFLGWSGLSAPMASNCPVNGCPPLTQAERWQLFGMYYIMLYSGTSLIAVGVACIIISHVAFRDKIILGRGTLQ